MLNRPSRTTLACLCTLVAAAGLACSAAAQTEASTPARATTGNASRDTLIRLTRPITVDFTDKRLEDVITFIQTSSAAEVEPLWADEKNSDGLDKEKLISVKVDNASFLTLIEKVLEKSRGDTGGENTWQMSATGAMQIGPKERLNKYRRVEIYDINDLLMEVPDYTDVPRIDLQQALQSSQGGGGGGSQSPFRDTNTNDQNARLKDRQTKADEVIQLITQIVEPEQWIDNGGSGGSIKLYQGSLIVNAPDYMHRGIDGYKYWPQGSTQASMVQGHRYVTLTSDAALARVLGFAQHPVVGVAGGKIFRSNDPPGGGGNTANPPVKPPK